MSQAAADTLVREGDELFRADRFGEAAACFERAVTVFPRHALGWRGLGHALLSMGKHQEAAHAFDQAIGLRPDSATALWGGALAHAQVGNNVIARDYLRRTIALQPTWITMALGVPQLASFLLVSSRAAERLHTLFGAFDVRRFHHAAEEQRGIEVGCIHNQPAPGRDTYVTIGHTNEAWDDPERPRVELVLATERDGMVAGAVCAQIIANLAFHLAETKFFPEPGTVVRDVVGALGADELSQRLPHVHIRSPRMWRIELPLDLGPPAITLAEVVPISEDDYQRWRTDRDAFEP